MCIVTDGKPDDEASTFTAAKTATAFGIEIITIPVDNADEAFLRRIATRADLVKPVKKCELAESMRKAAGLLPGPKQPPRTGSV